jgi:hypothetical protein
MRDIIEKSLTKSFSYDRYRTMVAELVAQGKSTGEDQNENLAEYTKLNNSRMKRLDKTFQVSDEAKGVIQNINKNQIWLVITESWCGDAAHVLPIINKLSLENKKIDFKIVLRDSNESLMNRFLTNGNKAIPKLILIDSNTKELIGSWGPRPEKASEMVKAYKAKFGSLDDNFKRELQVWYNNDKGENIEEGLISALCVGQCL